MLLKFLSLIGLLMLASCAVGKGVRAVYTQNGRQVYEAKCNGLARTISDCYAQASRVCDGEFAEVGTDGTASFLPSGSSYVPVNNRSLTFYCTDRAPSSNPLDP